MTWSLILAILLYLEGVILLMKSIAKDQEFKTATAILWPIVVLLLIIRKY